MDALAAQIRVIGKDIDAGEYLSARDACAALVAQAQADEARPAAPSPGLQRLVRAAERSAIAGAGACESMLAGNASATTTMQAELGGASSDLSHAANAVAAGLG